jgi:hypothetical protein
METFVGSGMVGVGFLEPDEKVLTAHLGAEQPR